MDVRENMGQKGPGLGNDEVILEVKFDCIMPQK